MSKSANSEGSENRLSDRTCMITGATSGIGRATALALARMGATLVLVCRDHARGEGVRSEIQQQSGNGNIELMCADLASQASIRQLADNFLSTNQPLHVLINNAGVVNLQRKLTIDGIGEVFAVNHLAYFLLTHLLLARLCAAPRARIVNVASEAHRFAKRIELDDVGQRGRYKPMRIYGHSKLANLLFTAELARQLAGTGVTANACHPGAVATRLGQNNGMLARLAIALVRPFFRSPERGAATSIYLASSPAVEGVSGRYFMDCREAAPAPQARDAEAAKRLWNLSLRLTGLAA